MRAERELKTGSFMHPFSRTPRFVGSIKKCLTYSSLLDDFVFMFEGKVATFKASPKAPGKEFESLTTKVPGAWLRSILIANNRKTEIQLYSVSETYNWAYQIIRSVSSLLEFCFMLLS